MATVAFTVPVGVTWRRVFLRQDSQGSRLPVTGMSARMTVRARIGGDELLTISTDAGTILLEVDEIEGSAVGTVTLIIPGPLTASLTASSGVYDVKLLSATEDGEPSARPLEGTITFDPAVTI